MPRLLPGLALILLAFTASAQTLKPHTLAYAPGRSITLSLPASLEIDIAAHGLRRVRFLAQSPDGRIFATGMYDLSDNTRGSVFILDGWNPRTHTFTRVVHFLDHLRNPNNLAFWTDPSTHQSWLYLPLTDKLVRYKYNAGDNAPSSPPQLLARFPDYGLNYKYGGWHLTRTVAFATLHGRTRLYLTAGSSCDYCREREVIRATLSVMDPDGSHWHILAHGLRNAVDLQFTPDLDGGALFATDMGDDHLGDQLPEDTFFELDSNKGLSSFREAGPPANALRSLGQEAGGPVFSSATPRALFVPATPGSPASSLAGVVVSSPGRVGSNIPNYGWPTCFFAHGQPVLDRTPLPAMPPPSDPRIDAQRPTNTRAPNQAQDSVYGRQRGMAQQGTLLAAGGNASIPDPDAALGSVPAPLTACNHVPAAYTTFTAHSSPLGLAFFGPDNPTLHSSFLVALHGASHPHIGAGYRVVRFTPSDRTPRPFITGFLTLSHGRPIVHGRPCGLLRLGPDTFLLTDDFLGLVYSIHPAKNPSGS